MASSSSGGGPQCPQSDEVSLSLLKVWVFEALSNMPDEQPPEPEQTRPALSKAERAAKDIMDWQERVRKLREKIQPLSAIPAEVVDELVMNFMTLLTDMGYRLLGGPLGETCKPYLRQQTLLYEIELDFMKEQERWRLTREFFETEMKAKDARIIELETQLKLWNEWHFDQNRQDCSLVIAVNGFNQEIANLNKILKRADARITELDDLLNKDRARRLADALLLEIMSKAVGELRAHVDSAARLVVFDRPRNHLPYCDDCAEFPKTGKMCDEFERLCEKAGCLSTKLLEDMQLRHRADHSRPAGAPAWAHAARASSSDDDTFPYAEWRAAGWQTWVENMRCVLRRLGWVGWSFLFVVFSCLVVCVSFKPGCGIAFPRDIVIVCC